MVSERRVVSHHYLRRRARRVAKRMNEQSSYPIHHSVVPATRGPARWYVIAENVTVKPPSGV